MQKMGKELSNLNTDMKNFDEELFNSLTLNQKKILKIIYMNPGIHHSDLATKCGFTITGLCNIISRMSSNSSSLFTKERAGQFKCYTLTPIASTYIEKSLSSNSKTSLHMFNEDKADYLVAETLTYLHKFQEHTNENWELEMYHILTGEKESNSSYFDLFIQMLSQLYRTNNSYLTMIYNEIENLILKEILKKYVYNKFKNYELLKPLFQLSLYNRRSAEDIIDKIFAENYQKYYPEMPDFKFTNEFLFEQYASIHHTVINMVSDVSRKKLTKREAYDYWCKKYETSNNILTYIAEKYSTLETIKKIISENN